jgi:hypothetical protein
VLLRSECTVDCITPCLQEFYVIVTVFLPPCAAGISQSGERRPKRSLKISM